MYLFPLWIQAGSPGTIGVLCRYNYTGDHVFLSSSRAHRAEAREREREKGRSVVQGNLATHEWPREKNEYICWGHGHRGGSGDTAELAGREGRGESGLEGSGGGKREEPAGNATAGLKDGWRGREERRGEGRGKEGRGKGRKRRREESGRGEERGVNGREGGRRKGEKEERRGEESRGEDERREEERRERRGEARGEIEESRGEERRAGGRRRKREKEERRGEEETGGEKRRAGRGEGKRGRGKSRKYNKIDKR